MRRRSQIAEALATSMLAGVWNRRAVQRRLRQALPAADASLRRRLLDEIGGVLTLPCPPTAHRLTRLILDAACLQEIMNSGEMVAVRSMPAFRPAPMFQGLDIPRLATLHDLAKWLDITDDHLADITKTWRLSGDRTAPEDYHRRFVAKASGPPRLIEAPKPRLKRLQRRILHEILDRVPVHEAAHGFVAGKSPVTAAQVHAGEAVVLSLDLKDFFLETRTPRVHSVFRLLGYPDSVARHLTALCNTRTPAALFQTIAAPIRHDWQTRRRFAAPHLPQGAPTSPALANLAAFGLDRRLLGLAQVMAANYSRYADDLIFSGDRDFAGRIGGFLSTARTIIAEEGFRLNEQKLRIMRHGGRQEILGVVVNQHCNIARDRFDELKAILYNCVKSGPDSPNRGAVPDFRRHLDGRIAWIEQIAPGRGVKLRALFEQIDWAPVKS
jgi:hypothetical protein